MNDGTVRMGYNGSPWSRSDGSRSDSFFFEADAARTHATLEQAAVLAAREIGDRYHGEKIVLMNGGGMDSEVMCLSFEKAGVPFEVACIVDSGGANASELKYVDREVTEIVIDMAAWSASREARLIAERTQQAHACLTFFYRPLLESLHGRVVVFGSGEPVCEKLPCCGLTVVEEECFYSSYLFYREYGIHGVAAFWQWSTDLYHAWLRSAPIDHERKHVMLSKEFGIKPRPKINWHLRLPKWNDSRWKKQWAMPVVKFLAMTELGVTA